MQLKLTSEFLRREKKLRDWSNWQRNVTLIISHLSRLNSNWTITLIERVYLIHLQGRCQLFRVWHLQCTTQAIKMIWTEVCSLPHQVVSHLLTYHLAVAYHQISCQASPSTYHNPSLKCQWEATSRIHQEVHTLDLCHRVTLISVSNNLPLCMVHPLTTMLSLTQTNPKIKWVVLHNPQVTTLMIYRPS